MLAHRGPWLHVHGPHGGAELLRTAEIAAQGHLPSSPHHSGPPQHSKGKGPGLLQSVGCFQRLLKHPSANGNIFLFGKPGKVVTHFHTAD